MTPIELSPKKPIRECKVLGDAEAVAYVSAPGLFTLTPADSVVRIPMFHEAGLDLVFEVAPREDMRSKGAGDFETMSPEAAALRVLARQEGLAHWGFILVACACLAESNLPRSVVEDDDNGDEARDDDREKEKAEYGFTGDMYAVVKLEQRGLAEACREPALLLNNCESRSGESGPPAVLSTMVLRPLERYTNLTRLYVADRGEKRRYTRQRPMYVHTDANACT